jgi:hypothetical protein
MNLRSMKTQISLWLVILLLSVSMDAGAQNAASNRLPGDQLSLPGVLEYFRKAGNLNDFEKSINTKRNMVNNLDLDKNGRVDYITVHDKKERDAHAIILRVPVTKDESQDVAVIEIEKRGEGNAQLQIIGDHLLYGENYILEPGSKNGTAKITNRPSVKEKSKPQEDYVNVWSWNSVGFIYSPFYVTWTSPWSWENYPTWWIYWEPVANDQFLTMSSSYGDSYRKVSAYRLTIAHDIYVKNRITSPTVVKTFKPAIVKQKAKTDKTKKLRKKKFKLGRTKK